MCPTISCVWHPVEGRFRYKKKIATVILDRHSGTMSVFGRMVGQWIETAIASTRRVSDLGCRECGVGDPSCHLFRLRKILSSSIVLGFDVTEPVLYDAPNASQSQEPRAGRPIMSRNEGKAWNRAELSEGRD